MLLCLLALALSGCNWIEKLTGTNNDVNWQHTAEIYGVDISETGRYIAFRGYSEGRNPDLPAAGNQVYVLDTLDRVTTAVRFGPGDEFPNFGASNPKISADGRYVLFDTPTNNMAAGDTNHSYDVYLWDRQSNTSRWISAGTTGDGDSHAGAISPDGRYVVFNSDATNLVPFDTYDSGDVFLRDTVENTTTRINISSTGAAAEPTSIDSSGSAISSSGRYILFSSTASNLVPNDTNGLGDQDEGVDIFVRDTHTGTTSRVSVSNEGQEGNGPSSQTDMSLNGRFVVFRSEADNLVDNDSNNVADIFLRDRVAGTTRLISRANDGTQSDRHSAFPSISSDGRFIVYLSYANALVPGDTNGVSDIFLFDRVTGLTSRVSTNAFGEEMLNESGFPVISGDGRYVVFDYFGTGLVSGEPDYRENLYLRFLPQLEVLTVSPESVPIGYTSTVTITGTNFLSGAVPKLPASVTNVEIVDENTILADVTVSAEAQPGEQDLSVLLPGTGPGPNKGAVAVCEGCINFVRQPPGC